MPDSELGLFLKRRRALISPIDVGLGEGMRRRVPGLRRTEVAELARISVEYYIELEQGRGKRPSEQVLASLARALRLDRDERDYLLALAGVTSSPDSGSASHVDPALLNLLDHLTGVPAQLFTDLYELIAQNDLATALLGAPTGETGPKASIAYRWFADPGVTRHIVPVENHEGMSAWYVADLRATSGRRPDDRRVQSFLSTLRASSTEFATLWDRADVAVKRSGRHQVLHDSLGLIDLECTALLSDDGSQRVVWYSPRVGSDAAEKLRLLDVIGTTRFDIAGTEA